WTEDELRQFHRVFKPAYRLDLDVPPPTAPPLQNIPEANELYKRAMLYKGKGWNNDFIDNQRRAELLLQQILQAYFTSDKIGDTAENQPYNEYRRAALYYERCVQWTPTTQLDARLRAARLYDRRLSERSHAIELYREVKQRETDPKRLQEAEKRLSELSAK